MALLHSSRCTANAAQHALHCVHARCCQLPAKLAAGRIAARRHSSAASNVRITNCQHAERNYSSLPARFRRMDVEVLKRSGTPKQRWLVGKIEPVGQ